MPPGPVNFIAELAGELHAEWPAIVKAKEYTLQKQHFLRRTFEGKISEDTNLVLFGSIAREEMTSGSDADWLLLVIAG